MNNNAQLPIGIFDSGVGGLTVLRSLKLLMPNEQFLYLGDTARLPYGTKSQTTVTEDSLNACNELISRGIKLLVVACNTVSALALSDLQKAFAHIPIIGVLEPGAMAACDVTQNNHILVLATEATINSSCYQNAIKKFNPNAHITAKSCGLFVSLAEEGLIRGNIPEAIARWYLEPIIANNPTNKPDCLLLGCTHFPILSQAIENAFSNQFSIVDSAITTAHKVKEVLENHNNCNPTQQSKDFHFLVTDLPERFERIARNFLEQPITQAQVELVHY